MVTINVISIVDACTTNKEGAAVYEQVYSALSKDVVVRVSFFGIDSVSSSFVNSAFIALLEHFEFDFIKKHLVIADSNASMQAIIKRRFNFETSKKAASCPDAAMKLEACVAC